MNRKPFYEEIFFKKRNGNKGNFVRRQSEEKKNKAIK